MNPAPFSTKFKTAPNTNRHLSTATSTHSLQRLSLANLYHILPLLSSKVLCHYITLLPHCLLRLYCQSLFSRLCRPHRRLLHPLLHLISYHRQPTSNYFVIIQWQTTVHRGVSTTLLRSNHNLNSNILAKLNEEFCNVINTVISAVELLFETSTCSTSKKHNNADDLTTPLFVTQDPTKVEVSSNLVDFMRAIHIFLFKLPSSTYSSLILSALTI